MNKDLIKLKVLSKSWSFAEISNLKETINYICEEVYNESTITERFAEVEKLILKTCREFSKQYGKDFEVRRSNN